MKTFRIFIIILGIFLTSSSVYAQVFNYLNNFKPGSEPDGYRGIKWGTDIATLKDLKFVLETADQAKFYERKGDVMEIGAAKIKHIGYGFWRGKFFVVVINTVEGSGNGLKYACFEKFGQGAQMESYPEKFSWDGRKAWMALKIKDRDEGELVIMSNEVAKQKEEYEKQKAKEGAKKEF